VEFPESFIDELVSRNEISDVVSDYVQLRRRGGNNLFGLCPFHSEKTPSFSVSTEKQIYYCFGCQKGGGVIHFIMEIEALRYTDAVHFLARRAGMTVPEGQEDKAAEHRSRLLRLHRDAARYYYAVLATPLGADAVAYLNQRGISKEMVKRFGLGAAPAGWGHLAEAMAKKGYSADELTAAGLVKKSRRDGVYDTFRNRLMFPVVDVRGNVIGFSGRILDEGTPKYLNSPDTMIFSKSRNLFGLNLAKKSKAGYLILAEGNIDVISLHQAGFDSAVASLGTSLTAEQGRLMAGYGKDVVIAYDADSAGINAAKRAIGILETAGLGVRVLRMEGAKDPDEFIKARGGDAFRTLLERSENHVAYRLLSMQQGYDLEQDEGRLGFLREATQLLAGLPNAPEREVYGRRVAEASGISFEAVMQEVTKERKRGERREKSKREREALRPAQRNQPSERAIRYENIVSAKAEEGVIRLLMRDPALCGKTDGLSEADFSSPFLGKAYAVIRRRIREGGSLTPDALAAELAPGELSHLMRIVQEPENLANGEKSLGDYIKKIETEKLKQSPAENLLDIYMKYRKDKGVEGEDARDES